MTTATFAPTATNTINVSIRLSPVQVKTALFAAIVILVNAMAML